MKYTDKRSLIKWAEFSTLKQTDFAPTSTKKRGNFSKKLIKSEKFNSIIAVNARILVGFFEIRNSKFENGELVTQLKTQLLEMKNEESRERERERTWSESSH